MPRIQVTLPSIDRAESRDLMAVVGDAGVVDDVETDAYVCLRLRTTSSGCERRGFGNLGS